MENNTNKPESKSGRFNIIDALIIVIALLLVLGAMWIFDPFELFGDDAVRDVRISYTVEIKDINDDFVSLIREGDSVIDPATGASIGTVSMVDFSEAYVWRYSEESSEMVKISIEGKVNVILTIEVDGEYESGVGYTAAGVQIAYGAPVSVRTPDFLGSGYCTSFKELG